MWLDKNRSILTDFMKNVIVAIAAIFFTGPIMLFQIKEQLRDCKNIQVHLNESKSYLYGEYFKLLVAYLFCFSLNGWAWYAVVKFLMFQYQSSP